MKNIKRIICFLLAVLMSISLMKTGSVNSTAFSLDEPWYEQPEFSCEYPKPDSELTVNYSPKGETEYRWFIGGEKIDCAGSTYIPTHDDLENFIEVEVYDDGEFVSRLSVFFSLLPVIYIDTENGAPVESKEEYINSDIKIQGNSLYNSGTTTLYNGKSEIKGRGNSTWSRFDKKPYKLKLDKKTDLFGLGKSKHWVLLANYIDESLMRNAASVELAKMLGAQHLDCVWVDVIFNGECVGNYQLYEHARIDKNRVDIFDWENAAEEVAKAIKKKDSLSSEAADAMEEYLVENTGWITSGEFSFRGRPYKAYDYYSLPEFTGGIFFEVDYSYDELSKFRSDYDEPVMIKSPEYLFTNEDAMAVAQSIVRRMESAFLSSNKMIVEDGAYVSYTDICDFDSLVSYFLTSELLQNEAGFKSTYFYKDIDDKIVFGPVWDFDFSSDNVAPFGTTVVERWKMLETLWAQGFAQDPYFAVKARELFVKNYDNLTDFCCKGGTVDEWMDYLRSSALKNDSIWHYSRGFEADASAFKKWMNNKIEWITNEFSSDNAALSSLGGSVSDKLSVTLNAQSTCEGYVINGEESAVSLSVEASPDYEKAVYCVNGSYSDEITLAEGIGKASVSTALFDEENGEKNVITVYLVNSDGSMTEKQFVTVTECDSSNFSKIRFMQQKEKILTAADGSYIYLGEPDDMNPDMIFEGWNDGMQTLPTGSLYKVNGNVALKPIYTQCISDRLNHSFINDNGDIICEECGELKASGFGLVDVSKLTYTYGRSKYYNYYTGSEVFPDVKISYGERLLQPGVDYNVSFVNNIEPGYATFTVNGIAEAGFKGEVSLSYKILPVKISSAKFKISDVEYSGEAQTPSFTLIYSERTLEEGKDFTAEYTNNTEIGAGCVTIKGIGGYSGEREEHFKILYPLSAVGNLSAENSCAHYVRLTWKAVEDADGYIVYRKSAGDTSYKKLNMIFGSKATAYFDTTAEQGIKYYYKVSSFKNYNGVQYEKISEYTALKADFNHKYTKTTVSATQKKDGYSLTKCRVCGDVKSHNAIYNISSVTLRYYSAVYTGKALKPDVIVKDSRGNIISSKNYSVSYSSNKNVGTAKVKITFKNDYSGKAGKTFKIVPAKAKGLKASSVTKTSLKLSWSKAKGAVYYRVQRSEDGKKWSTVSAIKGTSLKITKLSPAKTYRFRVITLDSSKKYSGGASAVIKVKTLNK